MRKRGGLTAKEIEYRQRQAHITAISAIHALLNSDKVDEAKTALQRLLDSTEGDVSPGISLDLASAHTAANAGNFEEMRRHLKDATSQLYGP